MRKFRSLVVAVAAMALMAGPVLATHVTWVAFDENAADPAVAYQVNEGVVVEVSANSDPENTAPKLTLWVCHVAVENAPVAGQYAPYAACNVENDDTAVWDLLEEQGDANEGAIDYLPHDFDTAGLGGQTIGFMSWREPGPNSQHPDAKGFGNLQVNVVGNGGDGHPGCKGIENAYEQVTTNHGSTVSKGKGAEALEKVAAKLGCDLSE
jgi:hypothetical protein